MKGKKHIVFIDRDGVINKDPGKICYVSSWRNFKFLPRALKALSRLAKSDFKIAIISNQAGVAKGLMTKEDLDEITENMLREILYHRGRIDSVQYCIHKEGDNCSCRKPKTGLFKKALKAIGYRLEAKSTAHSLQPIAHSMFFIGDSQRDIIAGKNFGCKTVLVLSGKTKKIADTDNWQAKPDYIAKDIYESIDYICGCRHRS